jgi:hypothetical protein
LGVVVEKRWSGVGENVLGNVVEDAGRGEMFLCLGKKGPATFLEGSDVRLEQLCAMTTRVLFMLFRLVLGVKIE